MQIYCSYFSGWGKISLHKSVLDSVYLCYPLLILLPLTIIHAIVAVDVTVYKVPLGPLPSSLFGVVVLKSNLYRLPIHQEESCVVLSSMHPQWYVPHLD